MGKKSFIVHCDAHLTKYGAFKAHFYPSKFYWILLKIKKNSQILINGIIYHTYVPNIIYIMS